MDGTEEYRRNAADCLWLARTIEDPRRKASLVDMAQAWLRLASQHDANRSGFFSVALEIQRSRAG